MNAFALKLLYLRRDDCALVFIGHPLTIILELFFDELTSFLSKASESYENFIAMWDFNIDVTNKGIEFDKLHEFCDLFNSTNLVTSPKCFTKTHESTIDFILIKEFVSKRQKLQKLA